MVALLTFRFIFLNDSGLRVMLICLYFRVVDFSFASFNTSRNYCDVFIIHQSTNAYSTPTGHGGGTDVYQIQFPLYKEEFIFLLIAWCDM